MNKILSLQSLHVKESVDLKRASSASVACSRKKSAASLSFCTSMNNAISNALFSTIL
ncbi:class III lanthipeptide [Ligilactobacillus murinus]|uniref:class III lanthipeptide n=1 Tax=Ligilactobacillus murinus TaxID=1622 RepID=UPI00177EAE17